MKVSSGFPGAGKTRWLPTEVPENVGRRLDTLGVTEEEQRISFIQNLTHGTSP